MVAGRGAVFVEPQRRRPFRPRPGAAAGEGAAAAAATSTTSAATSTSRSSSSSSSSSSANSKFCGWTSLAMQLVIGVLSFAVLVRLASAAGGDDRSGGGEGGALPKDFLTEQSVVLLTGAAGFLGSELALALHRTYNPSKIICIDSMDGIAPGSGGGGSSSNDNLALLEFKRQRVFNVMQTLGAKAHFYRTDFRPTIPEFAEAGEVPILHYIFSAHPDITHVVHLADAAGGAAANSNNDSPRVIPHLAGEAKAGMMESLLEEIVKMKDERTGGGDSGGGSSARQGAPHFVYASSHELYDYKKWEGHPNPAPFREHLPLTVPSSFRGASKLMDELLAEAYHESDGIYSVGLRLFNVYGPWSSPGSRTFELAEGAVQNLMANNKSGAADGAAAATDADDKRVYDYIFIDDAVDAIMTAMQFSPPGAAGGEGDSKDDEEEDVSNKPLVINVGSGQGTTLKAISEALQRLVKSSDSGLDGIEMVASPSTIANAEAVSIASTERAKALLGFEARVSLQDGLEQLLAWHYDRAFPYGGPLPATTEAASGEEQEGGAGDGKTTHATTIADKGIVSCSPYDAECLRGAPIYPCSSECAHPKACTTSVYDDVTTMTQQLTASCETALYTIDLDENLQSLPTASAAAAAGGKSFLPGTCNLAFVSDTSPLVRKQQQSPKDGALSHGPWTLVPLSVASSIDSIPFLELLPKLSPGKFFGSKTKYAIYTDPSIMFTSIDALLEELGKLPPGEKAGEHQQAHTALMVGQAKAGGDGKLAGGGSNGISNSDYYKSAQEIVQETAFRMIRIAVIDALGNDGFSHPIDSSILVHSLDSDDIRLFRCDVLEQVVQWDVPTDTSSLQFILGLHDLWNNYVTKRRQDQPWWTNGNLQEKKNNENIKSDKDSTDSAAAHRRLEAVQDAAAGGDEDSDDEEEDEEGSGSIFSGQHNGFGMPEAIQDAVRKVFGDAASIMKQETAGDDDDDEDDNEGDSDDEQDGHSDGQGVAGPGEKQQPYTTKQKSSSKDSSVWMGILSSSNTRHYARIVSLRQIGAIRVANGRLAGQ